MTTLLIGLLLIVVAILVAAAGLVAVRRRVPLQELRANHEVGGIVLGVIAHIYAILLAFVVVVVWGHYSDASSIISAGGSLGRGHVLDGAGASRSYQAPDPGASP